MGTAHTVSPEENVLKDADVNSSAMSSDAISYYSPNHLAALRRFAVSITVLNILGHLFLGFEQSYLQPLVALATAYAMQLLMETANAWASGRRPRYLGGFSNLVTFLLAAHTVGLSVSMLLYYNDRLWVVCFAVATAIASKSLFRVPIGTTTRHYFNPANFGICVTLLVFPWVGLTMPWQFSANIYGIVDWIFPVVIFCVGTYIHIRFTGRIFVVMGFLGGLILQAFVRYLAFGTPLIPMLAAATGIIALIYTFYMVPDPSTTPQRWWAQLAFGLAIPAVYLVLIMLHVVFGLFLALVIVCGIRGLVLFCNYLLNNSQPSPLQVTGNAN